MQRLGCIHPFCTCHIAAKKRIMPPKLHHSQTKDESRFEMEHLCAFLLQNGNRNRVHFSQRLAAASPSLRSAFLEVPRAGSILRGSQYSIERNDKVDSRYSLPQPFVILFLLTHVARRVKENARLSTARAVNQNGFDSYLLFPFQMSSIQQIKE